MRLLRVTALAAAAAAAAFALTAAVSPTPPADPPVSLPALTPQALSARYAASARAIDRAARAAARSGDPGQARTLKALGTGSIPRFRPTGQGEAVEVLGDLAAARRVAILVPGSDTSLATFGARGTASPDGGARAVAAQARRLDPGARLAVIAWLGYRTPSLLSPAVLTSGNAGQGAQALRPLVTSLARAAIRSPCCATATGRWSAGWPHRTCRSPTSRCTAARAWMRPRCGPCTPPPGCGPAGKRATGSGTCPTSACWAWASGRTPPRRPSAPAGSPAARNGHSSYLQPGTVSLRNLAYIALGEPAKVTR